MSAAVRRICYLSGTRADFGLMQSTLQSIAAHPALALKVIATGSHLSERFGMTVREIEQAGLAVAARIPVDTDTDTGAAMALNIARVLEGCVAALARSRPDLMLLLGDRGEMLAGALAALHLGIPIAHVHGGERSGTVDDPVRHAISKLAQFHFVATAESRDRLVRMGERADHVFVCGAPGLDGLRELAARDRADLCAGVGLDPLQPLTLLVYHPVVQEAATAGQDAAALMKACLRVGLQVLALAPNADAGSHAVRAALESFASLQPVRFATHLSRAEFVAWMAACDVMVGNSSSGIIEAATFGTPVCNIGTRQNLRQRSGNVVDVASVGAGLDAALRLILKGGRVSCRNVYGDGRAGTRIVEHLVTLDLAPSTLSKTNAY